MSQPRPMTHTQTVLGVYNWLVHNEFKISRSVIRVPSTISQLEDNNILCLYSFLAPASEQQTNYKPIQVLTQERVSVMTVNAKAINRTINSSVKERILPENLPDIIDAPVPFNLDDPDFGKILVAGALARLSKMGAQKIILHNTAIPYNLQSSANCLPATTEEVRQVISPWCKALFSTKSDIAIDL